VRRQTLNRVCPGNQGSYQILNLAYQGNRGMWWKRERRRGQQVQANREKRRTQLR